MIKIEMVTESYTEESYEYSSEDFYYEYRDNGVLVVRKDSAWSVWIPYIQIRRIEVTSEV